MEAMENLIIQASQQGKKTRELTNNEGENIVCTLLGRDQNGELKRGEVKNLSEELSVSRRTISTICNKNIKARQNGTLSKIHKENIYYINT